MAAKRKLHRERGWAVVVTWKRGRKQHRVSWSFVGNNIDVGTRCPFDVYSDRKDALNAKDDFTLNANHIKSARVVPVEIIERPRARKAK